MALNLASVKGRAQVAIESPTGFRIVDVARSSNGSLPSDPMACFRQWEDLRVHAASLSAVDGIPLHADELDCPVPHPRQLFAIGLNYKSHAAEMGSPLPTEPLTFAKFQSSLNTPHGDIHLVGDRCDYEAELVIVIGCGGSNIALKSAWHHVAGIAVGQDISDRALQYAGTPPQFSLGKSRRGFAPIGPWVTDMDHNQKRDNLRITCHVNGTLRQDVTTSDMIFDVPEIVAYLSSVCELFPGDAIFTGTSAGVGHGFKPPIYLKTGDKIETTLEGVGTIANRCL